MALGLHPDTAPDDTREARTRPIAESDLVVIAEAGGPTGRVRLGIGPGTLAEDAPGARALQRPVLRRHLFDALRGVLSAAEPAAIAQPPEEPVHEPGRAMRVLAAEDNKTNRLVLEKLLKSLDIELVIATDGAEAVELFVADPPDIVFTDISMPRKDGKMAAREMRAHLAETDATPVPIIAMTAHVMEEDRAAILAAGIDQVLTKPLKKDGLVACIEAAQPAGTRPPVPS